LPRAPQPDVTPGPSVIPPPACAVVAMSSVEGGVVPLTVQFSAEGMCTDATGVLTWHFGDESAPTHEATPTHVYVKPGSYLVRVTLADDENGATDSDELTITVTPP
jgi:PKD repeat protein